MSFINFNNKQEIPMPTYNIGVIREALNLVETKNTNKINKMLEGISTPLTLNEALTFFTTGKINAMVALTTAAATFEGDLNLPAEELESELDDKTIDVIDADGNVISNDPTDKSDEVEDDLVDGKDGAKKVAEGKLSWDRLIEKINEARSIGKIQKEWTKVTADMKDTVDAWKSSEGNTKEDLLAKLKTLTINKKKLEAELEDAVGLKDADAELVGESSMNDPVLIAFRAAKIKRERELSNSVPTRKPLYGKQREKAQDTLWDINLEIKDLYQDRDQLFYDMDLDAGQKGEEWTDTDANEYGSMLNNVEAEIEKLLTKRTQLEVKLAESAMYVNLNEDLRNDLKRYIKSNQKELDNFADNDDWDRLYDTLLTDFGVDDHESEEADELKTIFNMVY